MRRPKQLEEAGMVAIIVTMIMIIVISLIVLGFSQVARRNQRESLDRLLSSQAFYAAETGVNDVISKIHHAAVPGDTSAKYDYNADTNNYTNCSNSGSGNNFMHVYKLSGQAKLGPADSGVGYTCLLVTPNLNPVKLQVTVGSNKVVHLIPSQPITNATPLTFSWSSTEGKDATSCPTNGADANVFTPSDDWSSCPFGVLRFDLFNSSPPNAGSHVTDPNYTAGVYAVPANIASASPAKFGQPNVVKALCASGTCTATVKFNAVLKDFYIRSTMLYKSFNSLSISTTNDDITFRGAGVQIDATGKAQDVLRRVQVQIPVTTHLSVDAPPNAISSTDAICKRFTVAADGTVTPGLSALIPLCQPD